MSRPIPALRLLAGLALAMFCTAVPVPSAQAQEQEASALRVELNSLSQADGACTVSFVALNGLEADLARLEFEAVLFDAQGFVANVTLFDFGALPQSRMRVRQFVLPGRNCADLGQVLFNAVTACDGPGLAPGACLGALRLDSRAGVDLIG